MKMTPDQRKRFKIACAEENRTYGDLIMLLLDRRDRALAQQRRAQAHPLHTPKSAYPGGSHRA